MLAYLSSAIQEAFDSGRCRRILERASAELIASSTFKNTSVFTLVALMYLTMSIPLILLVRHFEKRAGKK